MGDFVSGLAPASLVFLMATGPLVGTETTPKPKLLSVTWVKESAGSGQPTQGLSVKPLGALSGQGPLPAFTQDGDALYVQDHDHLKRLDLATGTVAWSVALKTVPLRVVGDKLYLLSEDFQLHCLDAATGKRLWQNQLEKTGNWNSHWGNLEIIQSAVKGPVVAGNRLLVGTFGGSLFKGTEGNLYAMDATSGDLAWAFKAEDGVENLPVVDGGKVYFGGKAACYALDLTTGAQVWKAPTRNDNQWSFQLMGDTVLVSSGHYASKNAPSLGSFYALSKADGSQKWKFDVGGPSPMCLGAELAVGLEWGMMGGSRLSAIRLADGKKLWELKEKTASNPVFHLGRVVHVSKDDEIFVLDATTGKVTSQFKAAGDCGMSSFTPWARMADVALFKGKGWVASWDKRKRETVLQAVDFAKGTLAGELRFPGELLEWSATDRLFFLRLKQKDGGQTLQVLGE